MARILSLAGAALPRDLVSAHPDENPTGFWEGRSIIQLDDAILHEWGGRWDDPPKAGAVSDVSSERGRWILRRMFPKSGPVVLKDPRISFTSAFWSATLRQERFSPFFIVMRRPAVEVAASSAVSYGLDEDVARRLRRRYAEAALAGCEGEAHAVVDYAALLADPLAVLERIGAPEPSEGWSGFAERAAAFLSPALHRQRQAEVAPVAENDAFERAFEAAAQGAPVLAPPSLEPAPAGAAERPSGDDAPRWVLVTGAPRSGTTLLRALVDEHPDATILQEYGLTRFVRGVDALIGRPRPVHPSWASFAQEETALGRAAAFYEDREAAGGAGSPGDLSALAFDSAAQGLLATLSGGAPKVMGDKMPIRGEWEDLDYLLRRLPDLRVLLTLRNPRSVIHSSMIRRARQERGGDLWPIRSVQEAAEEWWLAWRRAGELKARLGPALHPVKYEDICAGPDDATASLYRWLGLRAHARRTPVRPLPPDIDILSPDEDQVVDNLFGEVVRAWDAERDAAALLDRFADLPRPYVPGRRVRAADEEADALFGDGFSWREAWGRWTDGERAMLHLRHGASGGLGALDLQMGRTFVPEGGACDVVVRAGRSPPQLFNLGEGRARIAMLCPLEATPTPGVLDVELQVLNPKSMHEPPADERWLGLGLESVNLRLVS